MLFRFIIGLSSCGVCVWLMLSSIVVVVLLMSVVLMFGWLMLF